MRMRVTSGSPYEKSVGFSRAVRADGCICVSGTAPIEPDGSTTDPGNAYAQACRCLDIIRDAVIEAGGQLDQVVRTRIYITDRNVWEDVARAHGEMFGEIRPASTMVIVSGLLREEWLVEIEADCLL